MAPLPIYPITRSTSIFYYDVTARKSDSIRTSREILVEIPYQITSSSTSTQCQVLKSALLKYQALT